MHTTHLHRILLVLMAALLLTCALMTLPPAAYAQTSAQAQGATPDGLGKLIIQNGTGLNAQVKVLNTSTHRVVSTVHVPSHKNRTITGIADGTYALAFWLGTATNGFGKKFSNTLHFQTIQTSQGVETTVYTVTLHAVVGGKCSDAEYQSKRI